MVDQRGEEAPPVFAEDGVEQSAAALTNAKRAPSSDSQDSGVGQEVKEESKAEEVPGKSSSSGGLQGKGCDISVACRPCSNCVVCGHR